MKKMFCTLALAMGISCAYGSDMPNLISLQEARVQCGQEISSNLAELPEDQRVRAGGISGAYGSDVPPRGFSAEQIQRGQEIFSNLAKLSGDKRVRAGDSLSDEGKADLFKFMAASVPPRDAVHAIATGTPRDRKVDFLLVLFFAQPLENRKSFLLAVLKGSDLSDVEKEDFRYQLAAQLRRIAAKKN